MKDLSLDSPRHWRAIDYAGAAFVVVLLAAVTATAFPWSDWVWTDPPTPARAHPMALTLMSALTTYLLFNHVSTHHDRPYLILAGGYLTVTLLLVVRALSTQSAVWDGRHLVGSEQSATAASLLARLVFAVVLLWTLAQAMWDRRHPVRPRSPAEASWGVLISLVAGLGLGYVALQPDWLPQFTNGLAFTTAYRSFVALQIAVTSAVVLLASINLRRGSFMARWLFVISLVLLSDAVISLSVTQRYQYGWYLQLILLFAALTVLLCALIWQLARLERGLQRLVRIDPLTGLASRQQLLNVLQQEMAHVHDHPVCALWIDLDGFKLVNDRLGHSQGDAILAEISRRLSEELGGRGVVGRLGGDEFGVALPATELDQGLQIAAHLRTAIEYPIVHDGAVTTLSATFGVACAPADADSAQSLLQRADEAMYVGKAQGGRLITAFQPQMHMQARSNAQRRHDLAQAISNGELTVWFQPIHDAFTGSVWGCEALVRWRRDGAVIPAKEFVPFAQMSGQIRQIGLFTVSSVQQAVMQLPSHVRDWSWTVNVSASELSSPEMVSRLKSLLDAAPDSRIVLEVTEETALNEGSAAESALIALHNSGALLAIDDFGSGFSNFAVLERLQPEIVKIDQALVIKAVEDNTRAQTFVAASIAIAHSLGAHVVAEGVEDERIRASLVRMGVDLLQGHYIGRPAPLDEVLPRADAPVLEHP